FRLVLFRSQESKIIGVSRHDTTDLIEFYTNVGNEEKNLAIVQYFYEYIIDEKIPFLNNKNIYVFKEPALKEVDRDYDVLSEEQLKGTEPNIVVDAIVGLGLGFFISVLTLWMVSLFSKKLTYSISYFLEEDDMFLLVDDTLSNEEELQKILALPKNERKYILRENLSGDLDAKVERIIDTLNKEKAVEEVDSIIEIPDVVNATRLIYFIEEGKTTRDWFKKQRKLEEHYNIPTFVVQINKA